MHPKNNYRLLQVPHQSELYDHIILYEQKGAQITELVSLGYRNILFLLHTWYISSLYINFHYAQVFYIDDQYYMAHQTSFF